MALIVGFPDFAAAVKPTVANLNAAVTKIVEQIGGVDGEGTLYPANLDTANIPAPGFRNSQKKEAHSVFAISVGLYNPDSYYWLSGEPYNQLAKEIGPFPMDVQLVGASVAAEGAGAVLSDAGLLLYSNDERAADLAASADLRWDLALTVPAGAVLRVEPQNETFSSGGKFGSTTITIGAVVAGDKLTLLGTVFTFLASLPPVFNPYNILIGADASATAATVAERINYLSGGLRITATVNGPEVTLTTIAPGEPGGGYTVAQTGGHITVPAAVIPDIIDDLRATLWFKVLHRR
jgi:hypothetical protein